jgi:hypothetical protein
MGDTSRAMTDAAEIRAFATAGRAHLTLSSKKTGKWYTYRITKAKDQVTSFISLLVGPDNEKAFIYLGVMDAKYSFILTKKSKMSWISSPVAAFKFFCDRVLVGGVVPELLEVRHEGRCGKCGRALTVPESIDRGIGPECFGKLHQ